MSSSQIVLATGVFDILHPGHVFFLEQAKKLGDRLVVIVTCDAVAKTEKGTPIMNQEDRHMIISHLRMVDEAHIGLEEDHFLLVQKIKPDIIVLGFDQKYDTKQLKRNLVEHNMQTKIVTIGKYQEKEIASSKIKHQVIQQSTALSFH